MATQNALFAILSVSRPDVVETQLQKIAPWPYLKLGTSNEWLLVAPAGTTTKEVCERVGIDKDKSAGIVVRVDTYFGLGPTSVWEWITAKREAEIGNATTA
jgi:hypothetical protein